MMSSGRRYTAVICCSSKNSILYLDPICYYRPDAVHVFVNNDIEDIDHDIETETFEKDYQLIRAEKKTVHECDTHDFECILSEISKIIDGLKAENEDSLDIFINITSGTHEFAAAAVIASMFNSDVTTAFRMDITKKNGRCEISEPIKVSSLTNDVPDREMIIFMEVLDEKLSECRTLCFRDIISELKRRDAWSYDPKRKSNYGKDSLDHKEITYLARHYVNYALDCGWITRPSKYRISITSAGRSLLNVHSIRSDECMNVLYSNCISRNDLGRSIIPQDKELFNIIDSTDRNGLSCNLNGKRYTIRHE